MLKWISQRYAAIKWCGWLQAWSFFCYSILPASLPWQILSPSSPSPSFIFLPFDLTGQIALTVKWCTWLQEVNCYLLSNSFPSRGASFPCPASQHHGGSKEMLSCRNSLGDKEGIVLRRHDSSLEIQRGNKLKSLLNLVHFTLEMN